MQKCHSDWRGLACLLFAAAAAVQGQEYFMYLGTYTAGPSKGIYAWRFQPATGKLTALGSMAEAPNPSFLTTSSDGRFLYAVNWKGSATVKGDTVSAYARDTRTGGLTFLNKVASRGEMPTHLALDRTGKTLMAVNFGTGGVAAFPVLPDGRLGEASAFDQHRGAGAVKIRQDRPHSHAVVYSPDNRFALVADLGLDQVFTYRLNADRATFEPNDPPFAKTNPGAGPRHLAFHPNGRFLYANDEIDSTVTVFAWSAASGSLKILQTVSTIPDFKGNNSTAEIQIDQAGRFLYVSNRGQNSIAVFSVDSDKGTLTPVERVSTQGQTPRNFSLDPTGSWLFAANETSSNVVLFRVDRQTGRLTPAGPVIDVPSPSCVIFVKAGE